MRDDTELLKDMEQLDERNIHANKLFMSLRSVPTDLEQEQISAVLLYFVACLIIGASRNPEDKEERIFIRRTDVPALIEEMSQQIKHCSTGFKNRDGLVAGLSVDLITRLMDEFQFLEPSIMREKGFALRVFDIMLRRILSEDYGISFAHSYIVASLAVSLSKANTSIIETFPYSGAICVTVKAQKKNVETYYLNDYGAPYAHQDLINLWLKLRNLSLDLLPREHLGLDVNDLIVVDGGQALEHGQLHAIETLEKLIKQRELNNIVLVIVDKVHNKKPPEALSEYIAKNDLLEAVIDLPSLDRWGNPTVITAWLLKAVKDIRNQTLCIDATHLREAGDLEPTWFAAAVLERWNSSSYKINAKRFKKILDSNLKELFLKHFEDRYRDLPGFCQTRSSYTVLNAKNLTAREHLGQEETNLKLHSPDNRLLLNMLLEEETGPSCYYIIGNNGSGKSLLLKDLIYDLDQEKLTSIGIAFGSTDRFPLKSPNGSFFEYEGARSKTNGLHQPEFLHRLSEALCDIYKNPLRLRIFTHVLDLLDFNHRHYLVPIRGLNSSIAEWELKLSSIQLSEDSHSHMKGLQYEPGLQRKEKSPIIPLSELSSGEQQILSLMIRICANADRHSVFLIDEPEISLHVSWQQRLPDLLSSIALDFECSFVVATHSPIIIANAQDATSYCFLAKDKLLTPIPSHQRHSVESILLDGFKTYTPHNREINERCAVLVSRAIRVTNQPNRVDPRQRKVLLDALKELKETMGESANNESDKRYRQDIKLINQADSAIKELFTRAKDGIPK